jgi:hypothetical protein
MFLHALGNSDLHSSLRRSIIYFLNVLSRPRQFQLSFLTPAVNHTFLECCLMPSAVSIYISRSPPMPLAIFNSHSPLRPSFTYSLNVLSCPRQFQFTFPAPVLRPQLPNKYYNFLYTSPFSSCFPGSAVQACSPYNSQFLQSRPAPGT